LRHPAPKTVISNSLILRSVRYTSIVVFKWDSTKAATNLRKHKVDFHEAATVLKDVLSMTYPHIDHSKYKQRYITIGIWTATAF
jgi:uncharacterized DUF497 family protein